ncbi:paraquat-inducible protein A [Azospirillum lipoferum]|uniref:Paraquat-inducible membrane protein A n=1 Tax=Azospirillum lipoferum TaxID=193 RepID=A0A5A9GGZ5_AZOLI|nr:MULTISPECIES: paraquat-inducible protein A [Azospirillum]KAA0593002.1 paraquat-inducible membrane protein A [Azospirillum lipoferum]MCP1613936.1 paraquat-inducible protein A [Azospirillum lipoferum]MDW5537670.1 paraquat-inducible protein A [Azospirillum sp. NL1]
MTTALSHGLWACPCCRRLCRPSAGNRGGAGRCPRCGATAHPRKPDSLSRTWAFLIAAATLYVPANLLPVMQTSSLLGSSRDTIISGVVYFWTSGSPGLALLIFSVSILVPLIKLGALAYLAFSVRRPGATGPHRLGRLYRAVELAGRWSMLDVFVIALMVGMVRFRTLATIEAGPGAAAFGAVVVLSMLAAASFDPRLLWDASGPSSHEH